MNIIFLILREIVIEYGIHIIRCTDVWTAPKEIKKLSDVPDELVEVVRTQMADPAAQQSAYSDYIEGLRDKADIHVNDMPAGVPYNVDMEKYVSSSSEEGEDDGDEADADDADADAEATDEGDAEVEVEADDSEAEGDDAATESEDAAADDASSSSSEG